MARMKATSGENAGENASVEEKKESRTAAAEDEEKPAMLEEEMLKGLFAVFPILYEAHQYKPGDRLPANNPKMTGLWVENGTAEWRAVDDV